MSAERPEQAEGGGATARAATDATDATADDVTVRDLVQVLTTAGLERHWLDRTSWVDVGRGWLPAADELYQRVRDTAPWQAGAMWRYEKYVLPPRLSAWYRAGQGPPYPELTASYLALRRRYGIDFDGYGLSYYR